MSIAGVCKDMRARESAASFNNIPVWPGTQASRNSAIWSGTRENKNWDENELQKDQLQPLHLFPSAQIVNHNHEQRLWPNVLPDAVWTHFWATCKRLNAAAHNMHRFPTSWKRVFVLSTSRFLPKSKHVPPNSVVPCSDTLATSR